MKQIKLEIHNHLGEMVEEDILTVGEGDKIILKVPPGTTLAHQKSLHEAFKIILTEDDKNVISIPDDVKIRVLKIK